MLARLAVLHPVQDHFLRLGNALAIILLKKHAPLLHEGECNINDIRKVILGYFFSIASLFLLFQRPIAHVRRATTPWLTAIPTPPPARAGCRRASQCASAVLLRPVTSQGLE
jgi:hypothetical protein